ncbi:hypothetical protein PAAG_11136 [Paracoccidioides lutzii Pb01]|uniref:Uncharacterized protein n=1 Tax=Paracoccidioides lutzii (strain ATCC MYA-826 / Pb01) TaxID=502779 RepID=A0A0A2V7Z5_PARBA|nr:hypothetical protein PAAG_11136 [Paracoccidioides lutzii Pb01]KGQ02180.1 hypothetical protein PAAG_11136 [Paracoccidioides lutzii Pb01]
MAQLARIIAALWLLLQLAAAIPDSNELIRVPREVWEPEHLAKRDDDPKSLVNLSESEKFVWASTDKPNSKAIVISMVAWSKQNERILDMDKFSFALQSANCKPEQASLKFKNPLVYAAAKIVWNWVNFNDLRSFVLVPDWRGCGKDKSYDPLVVSRVTFDDKTLSVKLVAVKSTWKKVMNTWVLDFGEVILGGKGKRDIIPDLDKKFRLNVDATLPTKIFEWKRNKGVLNATLTANCNDCGVQGTLIFAGHVEASLGLGGVDIDKFEISVRPERLQAGVNLGLDFVGHVDWRGLTGKAPEAEITLLEIPVSGWNIPGIFEFGPRIQLNAGYGIDYIGGQASASAGIVARIPDSSIAKVDLLAEDKVQISGWTPTIETQPLEIQAQIDAQARLYTEITLSVSLTVLDDNGFGVDLAFKVPQVTVTLGAGLDTNGFCKAGGSIFGVSIEAKVGVDLGLEGWKELDGDKEKLFDVTLFKKDDLYTFPRICLSVDKLSPGYCYAEEADEDYDKTEDDEEGELKRRGRAIAIRNTRFDLASRQAPGDRKYYALCDSSKANTIPVLQYHGPTELKDNVKIPIIVPEVPCPDNSEDCEPDTSIAILQGDDTADERAIVQTDNADGDYTKRKWATEHIYEANWIRGYLDFLQKKFNNGNAGGKCDAAMINSFFKVKPVNVPHPPQASTPETYIMALMQQMGTIYTEEERMAVLPMKQNNLKFAMFADRKKPKNLITWFKKGAHQGDTITHHRRSCGLARIVATCKYMNEPVIRNGLVATIKGVEAVLEAMDNHDDAKRANFSFKAAHKEFIVDLYKEAIKYTREKLKEYALFMEQDSGAMDKLPDDIEDQVEEIAAADVDNDNAWKKYCPADFKHDW